MALRRAVKLTDQQLLVADDWLQKHNANRIVWHERHMRCKDPCGAMIKCRPKKREYHVKGGSRGTGLKEPAKQPAPKRRATQG